MLLDLDKIKKKIEEFSTGNYAWEKPTFKIEADGSGNLTTESWHCGDRDVEYHLEWDTEEELQQLFGAE